MATTYKETFWDCPECHEPNISGVFNPHGRRCPNCFYHRRDSDLLEVRDISKTITDVELQKAAHVPDLVCGNPDCRAEFADEGLELHLIQCPRCESWMSDWVEKKVIDSEFGEVIAQSKASPDTRMENIAKVYGESEDSELKKKPKRRWALVRKLAIGGAATIGGLGATVIGLVLFSTSSITLLVESKSFEITTTIETYRPRSAADWEENVPTVSYRPGDAIATDQPTAYELGSKRTESKLRSAQKSPALGTGTGYGLAIISPFDFLLSISAPSPLSHGRHYLVADCKVSGNGIAICEDEPAPEKDPSTEKPSSIEKPPSAPTNSETENNKEVWDTWVNYTEWAWQKDKADIITGEGNVPDEIPGLALSPMQREKDTEIICYVEGAYSTENEPDTVTTELFEIDCSDAEQLSIGKKASLTMSGSYVWIEDEY